MKKCDFCLESKPTEHGGYYCGAGILKSDKCVIAIKRMMSTLSKSEENNDLEEEDEDV